MYLNSVQTTFSTNVIENLNPRGLQGISDLRILSVANFDQKRQKTRCLETVAATDRHTARTTRTTAESERLEAGQRGGDATWTRTDNRKRTSSKPDSVVATNRGTSLKPDSAVETNREQTF